MAIHKGRLFTSKRTSTASACRVAMATTFAFQRQCRSSLVQRSITWKSSYMASSSVYASRHRHQVKRLFAMTRFCTGSSITELDPCPQDTNFEKLSSFAPDEKKCGFLKKETKPHPLFASN